MKYLCFEITKLDLANLMLLIYYIKTQFLSISII